MSDNAMVARNPRELVARASSSDAAEKLQALRAIKNQIIGNKSKKLQYLAAGAIGPVLEALATAKQRELVVESAVLVGGSSNLCLGTYGTAIGRSAIVQECPGLRTIRAVWPYALECIDTMRTPCSMHCRLLCAHGGGRRQRPQGS